MRQLSTPFFWFWKVCSALINQSCSQRAEYPTNNCQLPFVCQGIFPKQTKSLRDLEMISPANISPGRFPPVHCSSQATTLDLVQSHNDTPVSIPAEKLMV
ncbi:hypothetical protein IWW34DRAFT_439996 [Fusarium oxysporum f. sp. albedinis]|nr:hypothetical protein IWW34DRAFT_439996 [Fusarium oxysporum f. sp. albedinis]